MENKTLGGWLLGLTIAEGVLAMLMVSDSNGTDYASLTGIVVIVQIVFAIIAARRLQK